MRTTTYSPVSEKLSIAVSELFGETMTLSFPLMLKSKGIGCSTGISDEKDLGWIAGVA
ncbi:MAG: hypothetical protein H6605_08630 [Flavobacteriales bacterium]|nr:hypothetical protein [Flavobacteriales bacterium]